MILAGRVDNVRPLQFAPILRTMALYAMLSVAAWPRLGKPEPSTVHQHSGHASLPGVARCAKNTCHGAHPRRQGESPEDVGRCVLLALSWEGVVVAECRLDVTSRE